MIHTSKGLTLIRLNLNDENSGILDKLSFLPGWPTARRDCGPGFQGLNKSGLGQVEKIVPVNHPKKFKALGLLKNDGTSAI